MAIKRILAVVVLTFCAGFVGLAQAKDVLTIVINKGADNPTSIAVVPFSFDSYQELPVDAAYMIGENLRLSGLFAPFDPKDMISRPNYKEDIFVKDWRRLGVQYVTIGRIAKSPGTKLGYTVTYELYDINNGQQLLNETLRSDKLERIANNISDKIYERLTGVPGFFSSKLAYLTTEKKNKGRRYSLQVADANGNNIQNVLNSPEPIMSPSWSPDGKYLTYVSFQNSRPNIFMQERRTGKQTLLTNFSGINGAPDWSPDGRKIALVLSKDGNPEIYIMDVKTNALERITKHYAIDTEPRWAPDGRSLIFTSNRGGTPQIYQVNLNDRKAKRLTFKGKYNARGQLTPDGANLVYVHQSSSKDFHIAVQNLKNGNMKKLTRTELDESPSIAPNGSMIVYATKVDGDSVLRMVTIDGNVEMEVPSAKGQLREPSWSPFLR